MLGSQTESTDIKQIASRALDKPGVFKLTWRLSTNLPNWGSPSLLVDLDSWTLTTKKNHNSTLAPQMLGWADWLRHKQSQFSMYSTRLQLLQISFYFLVTSAVGSDKFEFFSVYKFWLEQKLNQLTPLRGARHSQTRSGFSNFDFVGFALIAWLISAFLV